LLTHIARKSGRFVVRVDEKLTANRCTRLEQTGLDDPVGRPILY